MISVDVNSLMIGYLLGMSMTIIILYLLGRKRDKIKLEEYEQWKN